MSIQGSNLFYGTFTSDGNPETISFGTTVTNFNLWNLTQFNSTANPGVLKRAWFIATQPSASYFGVVNTNGAATDQSIYATTNGFTPIDYDALPSFASTVIVSVSQANPAVVTSTAHGLLTGDTVVLTSVTAMQQLSGMVFTVTRTGADTFTVPVNSSGFAAAGSGGAVRKIFLNRFVEREAYITNITAASSAVVTTAINHGYQVGDVVSFRVSQNGAYGMTQINGLQGAITAVGSVTTFTVNIDSSGFTAWTWPTSANAFVQSHPVVIPVGAAGTSPNYLGDATDNAGFKGLILGSAVCGASSDVIHWTASVGTNLGAL